MRKCCSSVPPVTHVNNPAAVSGFRPFTFNSSAFRKRESQLLKKIELPPRGLETLFGVHDQNIKYLESLLDVRINARGQDVSIDGDPKDVATAQQILEDFSELFKEGRQFTDKELREAFAQ